MSFRARVAVAAALAVAVAVILASVLVYVATRSTLRGEIDDALRERATAITRLASFVPDGAAPSTLRAPPPPPFGEAAGTVQVVTASGRVIRPPSADVVLPVEQRTLEVAQGTGARYLGDATVAGTHLRVLTVPVRAGLALQIARPLTEVDASLHRLRLLLGVLAAGGVALAAVLGALVARTAIRPLRALHAETREVARTRDLSRRIDVSGRDEVARLAEDFNLMLAALEDSEHARRQLVADASHELRTPLTSLRTNLEVLVRGDELPPEERASLLDDLVAQLEELTVLVGDLVDLARDGEQGEEAEEVRLDLLAFDAVERAQRHAPGLVFDVALEPTLVRGVAQRLDRAIANLLDNAIKWSPPDGHVEVTVRGGEVVVRDHGPGIPEEDLPHVFDRFYRAAAARGLPGSGLGLAIVRRVAEAHGGTALAANAAGGGAELRLRLPALEASDS